MLRRKWRFFSLFLIGVSLSASAGIILYTNLNEDLAITRASADNSQSEYKYTSREFDFGEYGTQLNSARFRATTLNSSYSLSSGYKALTDVNFDLTNVPINSVVQLCVEERNPVSRVTKKVLCEYANLQKSTEVSWRLKPNSAILLQSNTDYYCSVEVNLFNLSAVSTAAVQGIVSNCGFTVVPLSTVESVSIVVNASVLSEFAQGPALIDSELKYLAITDFKLRGFYAAVAADASMQQQTVSDICVLGPIEERLGCGPRYTYNNQADGRYTGGYIELGEDIQSGSQFSFSCRTATGQIGFCEIFAFVELDDDSVELLEADVNNKFSRRSYFSLSESTITRYCSENNYFYISSSQFSDNGITDAGLAEQRCAAIISGNNF